MDESPKEALVRALALIAVAFLLFWVATAIASPNYTSPEWQSQVGAAAQAAAANCVTFNGKEVCDDSTLEVMLQPKDMKCEPPRNPTPKVYYACSQEAEVGKIDTVLQTCEPGFDYTVTENKGIIKVTPNTRQTNQQLASCQLPQPPAKPQACTGQVLQSTNTEACKVSYCVGEGADIVCSSVSRGRGDNDPLLNDALRTQHVADLFKQNAGDSKKLDQITSALGEREEGLVKSAYQEVFAEKQAAVESASRNYEEELKRAGGYGGPGVEAAKSKLDTAQADLDAFKRLGEQKKLLQPPSGSDGPREVETVKIEDKSPCIGTVGGGCQLTTFGPGDRPEDAEAMRRYLEQRDQELLRALQQRDQELARALQQRGGRPPGGGGGQGGGGLGEMLQGLMKSLGMGGGGQEPGAGNQQPQRPGTCSTQTICGNNFLYSRNSQCVDTPVQHCPYGCNGNTCRTTPQDQQCPTPPPQPAAPGCSAGTWQPTRTTIENRSCVTDWQCMPSGSSSNRPTAEISCQPLVADVGMIVTISYGCSVGTSAGSGFNTNGTVSGSATSTIPIPPAGSNTVSYGLTCTNEGLTDTASCTVQVARPAIALVANPDPVDAGETTTIGWVTAGMESCTISSPEQSGFTAENESRTNASGTAESSPITEATTFVLKCRTFGGATREATLPPVLAI